MKEFSYLGSVLNVSGSDEGDCNKRVMNGRKIAGGIRALVNEKCLSMKCAKILHEKVLVTTLMYESECMTWKNKERWRIQAVQMDNLRGMIGVKRKDKMKMRKLGKSLEFKKECWI